VGAIILLREKIRVSIDTENHWKGFDALKQPRAAINITQNDENAK